MFNLHLLLFLFLSFRLSLSRRSSLLCVFFSLLFVCFFSLLPSLFLSVFPLSSLSSRRFLDFSWIPVTVFNPVSRRESQGKSQRPKKRKIETKNWQQRFLQSFVYLRSRLSPLQVAENEERYERSGGYRVCQRCGKSSAGPSEGAPNPGNAIKKGVGFF